MESGRVTKMIGDLVKLGNTDGLKFIGITDGGGDGGTDEGELLGSTLELTEVPVEGFMDGYTVGSWDGGTLSPVDDGGWDET